MLTNISNHEKSSSIFINTAIFFFLNTLIAQDFWEQIDFPDTLDILSFEVFNDEILIGTSKQMSSYGGLFKSELNDISWELFLDTDNQSVGAIEISSIGNIYILKSGIGKFLFSETNGESWHQINLKHLQTMELILLKLTNKIPFM